MTTELDNGTRRARRSVAAVLVAGLGLLGLVQPANAAAPGTALAWGDNGQGQLGIGSVDNNAHATPGTVPNLPNVVEVAAGADFSLALTNDGTTPKVWAWGNNYNGQLGDGTTTLRTNPVQVTEVGHTTLNPKYLTNVVEIAAGGYHALARKGDGTVWAWGLNSHGQLGNGDDLFNSATSAVQVLAPVGGTDVFLTGVTKIAGGGWHSLAIRSGGAYAWGSDQYGQLGDGPDPNDPRQGNSSIPVKVHSLATGVADVAGGGLHSLAAMSSGAVKAWGYNAHGELGKTPNPDPNPTPSTVSGISSVVDVEGGYFHSLARRTDGTLRAWGGNPSGQLGNGTTTASSSPVQVGTLTGVTRISVSPTGSHSLAIVSGGEVRSWGENYNGALGNSTVTDPNSPTPVAVLASGGANLTSVSRIGAGGNHSLAHQ